MELQGHQTHGSSERRERAVDTSTRRASGRVEAMASTRWQSRRAPRGRGGYPGEASGNPTRPPDSAWSWPVGEAVGHVDEQGYRRLRTVVPGQRSPRRAKELELERGPAEEDPHRLPVRVHHALALGGAGASGTAWPNSAAPRRAPHRPRERGEHPGMASPRSCRQCNHGGLPSCRGSLLPRHRPERTGVKETRQASHPVEGVVGEPLRRPGGLRVGHPRSVSRKQGPQLQGAVTCEARSDGRR